MGEFTLTIRTGNAVFDDDSGGLEIARILRQVASDAETMTLEDMRHTLAILDGNGNRVGGYRHHE